MKKLLYLLTLTLFISMVSCSEETTTTPTVVTDIIEFVQIADTITSSVLQPEVHTYAIIKNLTNKEIKIALEVEFTNVVDGHGLGICIGEQCLPETFENILYSGDNHLVIAADSQNYEYETKGTFIHKEIAGSSTFTFRYIPMNDDGSLNRDASIEYQCVCIK